MPFKIGDCKIYWPEDQYFAIQASFGGGVNRYSNDIFDIAKRAGVINIDEDNAHFNEVLAGELGVDLLDVEEAINIKVEREFNWSTFAEYKQLRHDTRLTFEEFVEEFQIALFQLDP